MEVELCCNVLPRVQELLPKHLTCLPRVTNPLKPQIYCQFNLFNVYTLQCIYGFPQFPNMEST